MGLLMKDSNIMNSAVDIPVVFEVLIYDFCGAGGRGLKDKGLQSLRSNVMK